MQYVPVRCIRTTKILAFEIFNQSNPFHYAPEKTQGWVKICTTVGRTMTYTGVSDNTNSGTKGKNHTCTSDRVLQYPPTRTQFVSNSRVITRVGFHPFMNTASQLVFQSLGLSSQIMPNRSTMIELYFYPHRNLRNLILATSWESTRWACDVINNTRNWHLVYLLSFWSSERIQLLFSRTLVWLIRRRGRKFVNSFAISFYRRFYNEINWGAKRS